MQHIAITAIRLDGGTQAPGRLNPQTVAAYAEEMRAGLWEWEKAHEPITVFYDGTDHWLAHGFHRVNAAMEAGLDTVQGEVRNGTRLDAQWYSYGTVNSRNGERLTNAQKRWKVENALQHPEGKKRSDNEIAQHCGVSQPFVSKHRASYNGYKIDTPERIVTRGGATYTMDTTNIGKRPAPAPAPAQPATPAECRMQNAECRMSTPEQPPASHSPLSIDHSPSSPPPPPDDEPLDEYEQALVDTQQVTAATIPVAAQAAATPDDDSEQQADEAPTSSSAMSQAMQVLTSQESNEWYTPAWVIGLVREVMGDIDLDPASSAAANQTVQARRFFAEDGLNQDWIASTLFLNPPYNKKDHKDTAAIWSRKLIQAHTEGRVQEACLLVFAKLGYEWFEDLWHAYPTCCFRRRLSFVRPDGRDDGQAKHGSAMLYLGPNVARFHRVFEPYGKVIFP